MPTEDSILRALNLGTSKEVLKANPQSPLAKLLQEQVNDIVKRLHKKMTEYNVDASRNLRQSTSPTKIEIQNDVISVGIESEFYWKFINYGVNGTLINRGAPTHGRQKPGEYSFKESVSRWIRDKGITPNNGTSYESLNFAIRKSIVEKGKKPKPFFSDVVNTALQRELQKPIEKLIGRAIQIRIIEPWQ